MKRLSLVILLGACGPKIVEFRAGPQFVCQGDTVRITFKVKGTPYLETVRRKGLGVDTTRYRIIAERRGKFAYAEGDVVEFATGMALPLVFPTQQMPGDSIGALDTLPASAWPDQVQIGLIQTDSGRTVRVRHRGHAITLSPGKPSSELQGLAVNGEWVLTSAILPNEVLGDPTRHPPARLYLGLSLGCQRETPP